MSRAIQAIGPSYQLADRKAAVQRAVNLYLSEIEGLGEDRQLMMVSAPGLTAYLDAGAEVRGSYEADSRWFVVAGGTLYEVVSGALVSRGALATTSGPVSMAHGSSQLVIVDGDNGYVLNLSTNALAPIVSAGWLGSDHVEHLDGYFIFVDPGTEQFYISAIDDASSLDALDFSSADTQPDDIITHRVFKRELYLLGRNSVEVWINSGGVDFPLSRYNSTPIQVGVVGKRAACTAADTLFFVGRTKTGSGTVYAMQGYQPVRISTKAVEEALRGADLSECWMWTYQIEGHEFVGIDAPGLSTTWVYDAAMRQWHELARLNSGEYERMDIDHVVYHGGAHYCAYGNDLLLIDRDAYTLDGATLVRERTWPHLVSPSFDPVAYQMLELHCSTGSGGVVTLEISNDGGHVFGSPLQRQLGVTGRRTERIRWQGLGSATDRVFRLKCSDAVAFSLYAANLEAA